MKIRRRYANKTGCIVSNIAANLFRANHLGGGTGWLWFTEWEKIKKSVMPYTQINFISVQGSYHPVIFKALKRNLFFGPLNDDKTYFPFTAHFMASANVCWCASYKILFVFKCGLVNFFHQPYLNAVSNQCVWSVWVCVCVSYTFIILSILLNGKN